MPLSSKEAVAEALAILRDMTSHHPNLVMYTEATRLFRTVPILIEMLETAGDVVGENIDENYEQFSELKIARAIIGGVKRES